MDKWLDRPVATPCSCSTNVNLTKPKTYNETVERILTSTLTFEVV